MNDFRTTRIVFAASDASLADDASLSSLGSVDTEAGDDRSFLSESTLQREQQQINYGIRMQFIAGTPSINRHNPPGTYSMTKPLAFMTRKQAKQMRRNGEMMRAGLSAGGGRPPQRCCARQRRARGRA